MNLTSYLSEENKEFEDRAIEIYPIWGTESKNEEELTVSRLGGYHQGYHHTHNGSPKREERKLVKWLF